MKGWAWVWRKRRWNAVSKKGETERRAIGRWYGAGALRAACRSAQRCCPHLRTVSRSSVAKPRLSTSSPISTTITSPANTRSV